MKKQLFALFLLSSLVACSSEKVSIKVNANALSANVQIHSSLVDEYFHQENYDYKDMNAFINAKTDLGDNLPIEFTWEVENLPDKETSYSVFFYDNEGHIEHSFLTQDKKVELINYKLNTQYRMTVSVLQDERNLGMKGEYSFTTPDGYLRTITVDGVTNFRDLGDGKKLKQGMVYRSATLTNNTSIDEDHPVSISEKGKEQIQYLRLKTRVDLRKPDEKVDNEPVIVNGQTISEPLYYGGKNILTYKDSDYNNPETIKNIFDLLADESKYPLDIHCVRGTDRTGCIAYLVKGLLGIDEEMLYRDFLFSNFYNIGSPVKLESIYYSVNPDAVTKYVNVIHQAEGETLKDKIYNYLSSEKIGVSTANLDKIIQLLKA